MPSSITQVQQDMKDQGLVVLAVSIKEDPATVGAWTKKVTLPFPVFLDEDGSVARVWRIAATPTVFLIDRRGRIVGKALGNKPWSSPAGRALLAALLAS